MYEAMLTLAESPTESPLNDEHAQWETILLHRIETGDVRLPVMPSTAVRALELANDPNVDTRDLSVVLAHDPAIAANIIRAAGTTDYAGGTEIRNLDDAVSRIGTRAFCQLVSAFAIQGEIYADSDRSPVLKQYRKTSLVTAKLASQIAVKARRDTGTAFLCGLLHTIGKPVVWHLVNDLKRLLDRSASDAVVRELVEGFHVEMARQICREWDMPPVVRVVCGRLQSGEDAEAEYQTEILLTSLAHQLTGRLFGAVSHPAADFADTMEARFLGLDAEDIGAFLDATRGSVGL